MPGDRAAGSGPRRPGLSVLGLRRQTVLLDCEGHRDDPVRVAIEGPESKARDAVFVRVGDAPPFALRFPLDGHEYSFPAGADTVHLGGVSVWQSLAVWTDRGVRPRRKPRGADAA